MTNIVIFLPPANEVCEAYVFTGVCLSGGMRGRGACVAGRGVCVAGGACEAGGMHGRGVAHTFPQQILRDTVNERAVRILLECILVGSVHQR